MVLPQVEHVCEVPASLVIATMMQRGFRARHCPSIRDPTHVPASPIHRIVLFGFFLLDGLAIFLLIIQETDISSFYTG